MTKGQLNKYIEELKIEAVRKVRDDCEVKRSLRKQEIIDNTDMISKFDRIKRYLKKSHELGFEAVQVEIREKARPDYMKLEVEK